MIESVYRSASKKCEVPPRNVFPRKRFRRLRNRPQNDDDAHNVNTDYHSQFTSRPIFLAWKKKNNLAFPSLTRVLSISPFSYSGAPSGAQQRQNQSSTCQKLMSSSRAINWCIRRIYAIEIPHTSILPFPSATPFLYVVYHCNFQLL